MQTEIVKALMGAAGAVGGATYVDDVFSTFLFKGNAGTQAINNGIDLAGEGGLVWTKNRTSAFNNFLYDTERGVQKYLISDSTIDQQDVSTSLTAFNSNGFTLGANDYGNITNGNKATSWTFRKAPGFFDVVTFTQASGTPTNQRISHSLGSAPGMIWMKCTSGTRDWFCYHRSLGKDKYLKLNSDVTSANATNGWGTSEPDATEFGFNANEFGLSTGSTYVAYLFAHDDQSYGENEDQSIIKCGSYSGNGSETNGTEVNLGWEPQWLLVKNYTLGERWGIIDSMRGLTDNGSNVLFPNQTTAEDVGANSAYVTSTGFKLATTNNEWNGSGHTYVYMAIRRSDGYVGKPADAGTDVFAMDTGNGSSTIPNFDSGFPIDFALVKKPATVQDWYVGSRLTQKKFMYTNGTSGEGDSSEFLFDSNVGWMKGTANDSTYQSWMWKRHAGFDVVTYKGNGSEHHSIYHSLNNTPQMIWIKRRDSAVNWHVFHIGLNGGSAPQDRSINLNLGSPESTNAAFNDYLPTSNQFKVGLNNETNANNGKFLAILFGSVDGVSKVGYYSGSDSSQTITTGFQPRFVIIRRNNTTQDWVLLDTLRGWASGNDTRLELNQNAAQNNNTDFGAPISTGFTLEGATAKCNASGGEFIYYAHA
jgi:hypothetical protein